MFYLNTDKIIFQDHWIIKFDSLFYLGILQLSSSKFWTTSTIALWFGEITILYKCFFTYFKSFSQYPDISRKFYEITSFNYFWYSGASTVVVSNTTPLVVLYDFLAWRKLVSKVQIWVKSAIYAFRVLKLNVKRKENLYWWSQYKI